MADVFENPPSESGEALPLEEAPLVEASYRVNGESQRRFQRKNRTYMIFSLVFGVIFFLCYALLIILNGKTIGGEVFTVSKLLLNFFFLLPIFLISFGVVGLCALRKNIKTAERTDAENHYRFFPDYVLITVTRNGERTEQSKSYYRNFVKVRENRDYFLLYLSATAVLPVVKSTLSEEDCNKLRGILPLKK